MLYKVKDKVYDHFFGWGEVIDIGGRYYPVKVDFDGEIIKYSADGKLAEQNKSPSLSFTEYDLINGGFSQERPKPKLEIGKSYRSNIYPDQFIINRKGDQENYGFVGGNFRTRMLCSTATEWQEITEEEAIDLLKKECVKRFGENWQDVKIKECLITPYNKDNQGAYSAALRTNRIWNRNGCIFKDGVWAEKLEEPEIKEGQMVWVRDNGFNSNWFYRPFVGFYKDKIICINNYGNESRWEHYSILNPYPDSIEARAIELLRYLYEISGNSDTSNEISEFLEEIDSYANNPE